MGAPHISDIRAFIKALCTAASRGVAAGTGDATEVTGVKVDRLGYGSAKLVFAAHANNTATKKLTLTSIKLSYSDDGSSWDADEADLLSAAADLVTGTGDQYGQLEYAVKFDAKKRYVRAKYTPDHTASATDTFEVAAVFVLGGADTRPAA